MENGRLRQMQIQVTHTRMKRITKSRETNHMMLLVRRIDGVKVYLMMSAKEMKLKKLLEIKCCLAESDRLPQNSNKIFAEFVRQTGKGRKFFRRKFSK